MAGICYCGSSYQILAPMRIHGIQCCSDVPNSKKRGTQAPKFLRTAVNGVTEFLRLFSSPDKGRLDTVNDKSKDENLVSNVDDVLMIIKSDYEKAYFVTDTYFQALQNHASDAGYWKEIWKRQGDE